MRFYVVFALVVIVVFKSVSGQVSLDAEPVSTLDKHLKKMDFITLRSAESKSENLGQYPLYAGYTIPFNDNDLQYSIWETTGNDWQIWRIGLIIPKAEALNVYFEDFNLLPGDRLFIYKPGMDQIFGAFSQLNNDHFVGTTFLTGDTLIIEYNTLNNIRSTPFSIKEIGVSVIPSGKEARDFGDSGNCEVLVNCPEGEDYQDEKRGVARVLVKDGSSLFWCSGSLVNNTNRDGTPYFLTAHHCGEDASIEDYSQWVFYFNFESSDCEMPVLEPEYQSISGAKLIADGRNTGSGSDFKLLLLEEEIPKNYNPYFNGWSRSVDASGSGVGIHHPDGDLKMISTYSNPLISTNYINPTPNSEGRFWHVVWSETQSGHGVTEGGSSGSPILNPDGYIVGTLSGGRASCSQLTQPDYYGKFSVHWDENGYDSTDQLKPWLDPIGSDVVALRGIGLDTTSIRADFGSDLTEIKVGGGVQFYNKSQGNVTAYKWEFEGGEPEFAESETPPQVYYQKTGEYDVKLVIKSQDDSDSLAIKNYVRVLPNLYPNPSIDGKFHIIFGQTVPDDLEIAVYSIDGRILQYVLKQSTENSITIDLGEHPQGIYLIQVKSEGNTQIIKAGNKIFAGLK